MIDFDKLNPWAVLTYFLPVIFFSVVFTHPLLVAINVVASFIAFVCISKDEALTLSKFSIFTALLITFINPFFQTHGRTVIFKYFGRSYTLESLVYGAVLAGIFLCSINWFSCLGKILTSEKLMFLLGGKFPNICIIFSTVLGLIPYFSQKLAEIIALQENLHPSEKQGLKKYMQAFSVATDYAFEHAVNMAVSMKNRGFGSGKATRYISYKIRIIDYILALFSVFSTVVIIFTVYSTAVNTAFIPRIKLKSMDGFGIVGAVVFTLFLLTPSVIKVIGELKWKHIASKI